MPTPRKRPCAHPAREQFEVEHDRANGIDRRECRACGSFRLFRRRPGRRRRFLGPWHNPHVIDAEPVLTARTLTLEVIQASLKLWAHSMIERGADIDELRQAFLAVAALFYQDETSADFSARAALVHSLAGRPDDKELQN